MTALRTDEEDRSSSEARFETLYERYHGHVRAYCRRRVVPDRVDDVVAETFLTAWKRIADVPEDGAALLWLYRVAYRNVGHQWRGQSRRRRLDERLAVVPEPPTATPEDAAVLDDEIHLVLEAAANLNERDAEILRLLSWEHLSREEIAEVLDLNRAAVNQRIHRARANLTKEFRRLERRRPDRTPAAPKGGTP